MEFISALQKTGIILNGKCLHVRLNVMYKCICFFLMLSSMRNPTRAESTVEEKESLK